ncbi:MAG: hypothetical protein QOF60_1714, partial [Actinomycetota bacterium]|nr:hypothetical protein [Actinomycetota bacterium]
MRDPASHDPIQRGRVVLAILALVSLATVTVAQPAAAAPVAGLTPTVVVTDSPSSTTTYGDDVTFEATVTVDATPVDNGSVDFYDDDAGTTLLASVAVEVNGKASFTTGALDARTHVITATYGGGTMGDGSVDSGSGTVSHTVQAQDLSITLQSSPADESTYGQVVQFTANVTPSVGGCTT